MLPWEQNCVCKVVTLQFVSTLFSNKYTISLLCPSDNRAVHAGGPVRGLLRDVGLPGPTLRGRGGHRGLPGRVGRRQERHQGRCHHPAERPGRAGEEMNGFFLQWVRAEASWPQLVDVSLGVNGLGRKTTEFVTLLWQLGDFNPGVNELSRPLWWFLFSPKKTCLPN